MIKKSKFGVSILFLVLLHSIGWGYGLNEVTIHGFITHTHYRAVNNPFLTRFSEKGHDPLSEIAINFTSKPTDRLRIGTQLIARDNEKVGNHTVKIDWAVADYHITDRLGVRIGKIKRAWGLYNEGRDIDILRTSIFLPQGIYDEEARNMVLVTIGAELYGNLNLGDFGDLGYRCYDGIIDPTEDHYPIEKLANSVSEVLKMIGKTNQISEIQSWTPESVYMPGMSLMWNTSVEGLRLGYSTGTFKVNHSENILYRYGTNTEDDPIVTKLVNLSGTFTYDHYSIWSAEYDIGDFVFAYEKFDTCGESVMNIGDLQRAESPRPLPNKSSYRNDHTSDYVMCNWRFSEKLTLGSYAEIFYVDKNDKDGDELVASALQKGLKRQKHQAWHKDLCFSIRYDLEPNFIIKLEQHYISGTARVKPGTDPAELKRRWNMWAVKTSYYF